MSYQRLLQQIVGVMTIMVLFVGCSTAATTRTPGIKPVAGGFQGGNMYIPGGKTFNLLLVVAEKEGDAIDSIQLACAPKGKIVGLPVTIATDIKIDNSQFRVESNDVIIEGQFVSSMQAEGIIRALTEAARKCGVPAEGQWVSECNLSVQKNGDGYVLETAESGACVQP